MNEIGMFFGTEIATTRLGGQEHAEKTGRRGLRQAHRCWKNCP